MQNLLQCDQDLLQAAVYSLKAKAQSLSFGRYLYQLQKASNGDQVNSSCFWLKGQSMREDGFQHAQQGFLQEQMLYQQWSLQGHSFLLPHRFISVNQLDHRQLIQADHLHPQLLLLPHAESIFSQDSNQFTSSQIKALMIEIVSVLAQLTELGWLHADLKAGHFVRYQGQVRLLDFEQAVLIASAKRPPMNATPRYMAPELFHGQPKSVQSDLYALGIVLLEWLTAQRLQAHTYKDWAVLHCQRLTIDLPQQFIFFEPILRDMLAKQKTQRMRDFSQIKMRLISENV
ncbi:hypothetical protein EXE25_14170 [Acinetobacter bouvetii]|uniref:Protein kinase domain-containing protein n=1 Tax=Acinetobacter bouvetii TaxID=202951 RepID=A0A4Q7APS5_9GAMM|nr:protein kinase [Acinetobacter bouvetii]RZG65165.1 hypothetical protein EXE25_14170 [Acinetobacter bouvetii]